MAASPVGLTTSHLSYAVVPDSQQPAVVSATVHFEAVISSLDVVLTVAEAWKGKLGILVDPPEPATLQELVQAGRRRLRDDRLRADTEELHARHYAVSTVKAGLSS